MGFGVTINYLKNQTLGCFDHREYFKSFQDEKTREKDEQLPHKSSPYQIKDLGPLNPCQKVELRIFALELNLKVMETRSG
jgi:hypothetical protein